jgi:hypothetical protein
MTVEADKQSLSEKSVPAARRVTCPSPQPRSAPTAGFAQPAGCGGAEQCSAKPRLRPRKRGEGAVCAQITHTEP